VRASFEYNLALGEKSANSVKAYLQQLGIDASRLSTVSLGEERPVDSGHTEEAWSKNRRNEFVVLSQ
jgi:peptidoglycan-associated lipoprotein